MGIDTLITNVQANWVEYLGAILGLVYIIFSVRQSILTWPVGLLTSLLYIIVFFNAKFYADMMLQVYYMVVSIYGWYFWLKGSEKTATEARVNKMPTKMWPWIILAFIFFFFLIYFVLFKATDSQYPVGDSLTTALSIVATWMLARKYIENWILWIFIDAFSAQLYVLKELWPTVILFAVYTIMAIVGFCNWKKELEHAK